MYFRVTSLVLIGVLIFAPPTDVDEPQPNDSSAQDEQRIRQIRDSGLSIYHLATEYPELYLDDDALERIIERGLRGKTFDQPIRTRQKSSGRRCAAR